MVLRFFQFYSQARVTGEDGHVFMLCVLALFCVSPISARSFNGETRCTWGKFIHQLSTVSQKTACTTRLCIVSSCWCKSGIWEGQAAILGLDCQVRVLANPSAGRFCSLWEPYICHQQHCSEVEGKARNCQVFAFPSWCRFALSFFCLATPLPFSVIFGDCLHPLQLQKLEFLGYSPGTLFSHNWTDSKGFTSCFRTKMSLFATCAGIASACMLRTNDKLHQAAIFPCCLTRHIVIKVIRWRSWSFCWLLKSSRHPFPQWSRNIEYIRITYA